MNRKISYLILLFSALSVMSLHAQPSEEDYWPEPEYTRKPWYFSLNFDFKAITLSNNYKSSYEGEMFDIRSDVWSWKKIDSTTNPFGNKGANNVKLDVTIARNRSLRFGLSYNMGIYEHGYDQVYNANGETYEVSTPYIFLAISGLVQYNQYIDSAGRKHKPYVYASGALGSYRSGHPLEGPGTQLFTQGRLGAGIHFKNNYMIHVFYSYDYLRYRDNSQSVMFEKPQNISRYLNSSYIGFGLSKEFTIVPE